MEERTRRRADGLPADYDIRAAGDDLLAGVHVALVVALAPVDPVEGVLVVDVDKVEAVLALDHVPVRAVGVGPHLVVAALEQDPVLQAVAYPLEDQVAPA